MARDLFHDVVRAALEREGWTITDDPLILKAGGVDLFIDPGAERLIGAEKQGHRIAVEVKSFVGPSPVADFHAALGQYLNYRLALEEQDVERVLYLAVPADTYASFFSLPFARAAVERYELRLIVFDAERPGRLRWPPA